VLADIITQVTHHLVKKNVDSGVWTVNGNAYGDPSKDIESLLEKLTANPPPDGWPVALTACERFFLFCLLDHEDALIHVQSPTSPNRISIITLH
jgi:hypothetical protein